MWLTKGRITKDLWPNPPNLGDLKVKKGGLKKNFLSKGRHTLIERKEFNKPPPNLWKFK